MLVTPLVGLASAPVAFVTGLAGFLWISLLAVMVALETPGIAGKPSVVPQPTWTTIAVFSAALASLYYCLHWVMSWEIEWVFHR